jgi:serine/threonine protein kinase
MSSAILTIGNYRLLEELASGAFGRVHRAEHIHLSNRIVAVKLLHAHLSSEKEQKSFLHEANILEMLKHAHILPILDVGIHEGRTPYMITEFASQGSLRQRLSRQTPQLLPFEETLRILTQVAQALQIAHQQQIVHRDLKPENILFHTNGNALLADFGISTVLGSMSVQQATITGTPPYMAPEQFKIWLQNNSKAK